MRSGWLHTESLAGKAGQEMGNGLRRPVFHSPFPIYAARSDFVFAQALVNRAGGDSSGSARTRGETK
jgi:hypothetical protein